MFLFLSLNGLDASQMGISKTNKTQNIERKVISRSNLINLTTKYTNIDAVKKQNTKLYHAQSKKISRVNSKTGNSIFNLHQSNRNI